MPKNPLGNPMDMRKVAKEIGDQAQKMTLETAKVYMDVLGKMVAGYTKEMKGRLEAQLRAQTIQHSQILGGYSPTQLRAMGRFTAAQSAAESARMAAYKNLGSVGQRHLAATAASQAKEASARARYTPETTKVARADARKERERTSQAHERTLQLGYLRDTAHIRRTERERRAAAEESIAAARKEHIFEVAMRQRQTRTLGAEDLHNQILTINRATRAYQPPQAARAQQGHKPFSEQDMLNFIFTIGPMENQIKQVLGDYTQRTGVQINPQEASGRAILGGVHLQAKAISELLKSGNLADIASGAPTPQMTEMAMEGNTKAIQALTDVLKPVAEKLGIGTGQAGWMGLLYNAAQQGVPNNGNVRRSITAALNKSPETATLLGGTMQMLAAGGAMGTSELAQALATGDIKAVGEKILGQATLRAQYPITRSLLGTAISATGRVPILGAALGAAGGYFSENLNKFAPQTGGGGGGILGRVASGIEKIGTNSPFGAMGLLAAGAGAAELVNMLWQGMMSAMNLGNTLNPVYRQLATSEGFGGLGALMGGTFRAGNQFGLSPQMSTQILTQLAAQVGPAVSVVPALRTLAGASAGMGFEPQQLASGYGSLVQLGVASGPTSAGVGPKQFADMLAAAVVEGQMQGRQGEVLQALLTTSQLTAQTLVGIPLSGILGVQSALNATGIQGLMGMQGTQVLSQLAQGMASPGMGGAGQLLNLRMFGQPGMTYAQTLFSEQAGPTYTPPGGTSNFIRFLQGMHSMFPGVGAKSFNAKAGYYPLTNSAGMSELLAQGIFGLSMSQVGALMSVNPKAASQAIQQTSALYGSLKGTPTTALSIWSDLAMAGQKSSASWQRHYLTSAGRQLLSTVGNVNIKGLGSIAPYVQADFKNAGSTTKAITDLETYLKSHPNNFLTSSQKSAATLAQLESLWLKIGQILLPIVQIPGNFYNWVRQLPGVQNLPGIPKIHVPIPSVPSGPVTIRGTTLDGVPSKTLNAFMMGQSRGNPYSIYDDTAGRSYTFKTKAQYLHAATILRSMGHSIDMGLFQINSKYHPGITAQEAANPVWATKWAANDIASLLHHYHGNLDLAAAAYNSGEGAVDALVKRYGYNYNKIWPHLPTATDSFVKAVNLYVNAPRQGSTKSVVNISPGKHGAASVTTRKAQ